MSHRSQLTQYNPIENLFRLKPLVECMRVVITSGLFASSVAPVYAELVSPMPGQIVTLPGNTDVPIAVGDGGAGWVTSGSADLIKNPVDPNTHKIDPNAIEIDQHSGKAILNWKHFNVGKDATVRFKQNDSSSIALNRISDDQNGSVILGHITANGQVYLSNKNGFVFGEGSVVDTNGLVVTALDISKEVFEKGIIREFEKDTNPGKAALDGVTGDPTTAVDASAKIIIDKGANIHVGKNSNVIIAAPEVKNSGSISADEKGQILLVASKDKVYLQPASKDSPFAGLLVEVGSGGKVSNEAGGEISARQGNVTLAGFAVNQGGGITATTSVNVNGSVRLLARENATDAVLFGNHNLKATSTVRNAGTSNEEDSSVTFGKDSSVKIVADSDGATAIDDQAQKQSYVEVSANKIDMQSGSSIVAPNAKVNFTATNNLDNPSAGSSGQIKLENGSRIDVAGIKNVKVAMERNVANISVQSFNLRDAPDQRGGVLQGKTVQVDIRKNTNILDASGGKASIHRSVEERMGNGGEINLASSGKVSVDSGAVADISGGSVSYQDGYINTTKLVTDNGRVVDISDADPNEHYTSISGIVTESHSKWGVKESWNVSSQPASGQFEKGYTDGKAGGAVNIQSPLTAWNGKLVAGSVNSPYQRTNPVSGGEFNIKSNQNVFFQTEQQLPDQINDLVLSTALTNESGISSLSVNTGGAVTVTKDAVIKMPALSKFNIDAAKVDIDGSIYTPGGSININSSINTLNLASTSVLDVSGKWVNDFQNGLTATQTDPVIIKGGNVSLNAFNDLNFNKGATIKADGGAWLSQNGIKVTAGKAGSIKLASGSSTIPGVLHIDGGLSAYGLYKGGDLTLVTNKINVGSSDGETNALNLGISNGNFDIVANSGFSTVNLESNNQNITVKSNTDLSLIAQNKVLNDNYREQTSAKSIADFSHVATLPEHLRAPVTLDLKGRTGVTLETGSAIRVDKESKVNISTSNDGKGIYIDGLIEAQAGAINLDLNVKTINEYDPTQSIWLGSHADLSTHGTTRLNPRDVFGNTSGDVLAGGNVKITANRGYVVLEQGSKIDVSGTSANLNLPISKSAGLGVQMVSRTVGSDAGKISLTAAEGIVLDGTLSASAGSALNHGGRLDVTLDRNNRNPVVDSPYPINPLQINVVQDAQRLLPADMKFGSAIPVSLLGHATVSGTEVKKAGIDDLRLNVPVQNFPGSKAGEVRFIGDVDLSTASSIVLDTQTIGWAGLNGSTTGAVTINTPYLQIGSSTTGDIVGASQTGGGQLTTNASWTQVTGASLLTGFNQVNLNSSHDLRAVGVRLSNQRAFTGNLNTAADLNLNASQIYPTTLTNYTFAVTRPAGQLTISGRNTDTSPLTAAGKLTFNAPVINQNGVLKAPLGTIELNASTNLSFGKDSVTSVSANGKIIPFGLIANNLWEYPVAPGNLVFNESPNNLTVGEKHIVFKSPDIEFKKGSIVDVSGGGDLQAYEFQPGLGGSYDYLDPASKSYQGGFAVLPKLGSSLAPYDPYLSANFAYDSRATVYLNGAGSLPAGEYVILPARYALLPGAFLVTPQAGTQDQVVTTHTKSGLPIVSGYQTLAGTNTQDSRRSGYLIETSADVKKHSQYDIQRANSFFAQSAASKNISVPLIPADSGQISIDASTKLVLQGQFKVDAPQGRGAKMDISATNIKVVNNLSASATPGILEILDKDLSNLKVDSLLLGGTRKFDNLTGNTNLTVSADDVTFEQGTQLQMLDLVAAGKNTVEVKNGATISGSGSVNTGDSIISIAGDSALLRVSADKQVSVSRTASPGLTGSLLIDQGAVLQASKSMLLDASKLTALNGDIAMKGGALSLTANTINVGEISGTHINDLNLSNQKLLNLTVDDLVLNSRSSINFYGDVGQIDTAGKLAPIQFKHLVLDAAALSGFDNTGKAARLQANSLQLQNTKGATVTQSGAGTGTLDLIATDYSQGQGSFGLDGFKTVNINVDKQFTATDNSVMNVASDLNLTAGSITATGGHSLAINANSGSGHDVLISGNSTPATSSNEFGGAISINANKITLADAEVLLPSGSLRLQAQTGDILVDGKTNINLAGRAVNFADTLDYTPGGTFSADAKHGQVLLTANSSVDVSTGGGKASGGELIFKAPEKMVELAGKIKATGASAAIDVADFTSTAGFDVLMNKLMTAGVSDSLYFRTHYADITQAAGNEIKANSISLVADKGVIDISGKVNADGSKEGGAINLSAGDKITLENGAQVTAKGADKGGKVLLSSVDSLQADHSGIEIKSGSAIDVSGANAASGGIVTLSALRTSDNINIKPIAGTVQGYSQFYAQGVKTYSNADLGNDGAVNGQDITRINDDTAKYLNAAVQNVTDSLGGTILLRPGVEIDYNGDLALASAWDFSSQRFGQNLDIPGTLAIRASGKLELNNSLTDGFDPDGKLQTGDSWSFQLVAGADQNSADKLATAAAKDLNIGSNTSIHTGSGNMQLVAGGNIVFKDKSSVYSAGRADLNDRYGTLDGNYIGTGTMDGIPLTSLIGGEYPVNGGEIFIRAGTNIIGAVSDQFLDPWLQRQGNFDPNTPFPEDNHLTAWSVDASQFKQNIGSFGGGKVNIVASGNISDLSVMMPTTGKQQGLDFINNIVKIQGGGQMNVNAGGDIVGGAYFLGKGEGVISAGGEIKGSINQFKDGPQIVMSGDQSDAIGGNSNLTLNAKQGIKIAAVTDAMILSNSSSSNQYNTHFFSYTDKSKLTLKSLSGDVHLGADTGVVSGILNINSVYERFLTNVYPASLDVTAFNGSVKLDNDIVLFPSASSNLNVLAKQDISSSIGQYSIIMSDADPALLPNAGSPLIDSDPNLTAASNKFNASKVNQNSGEVRSIIHALKPVHTGDKDPARLVTQVGDISSVQINLPKQAIIQAGRDLINSPIQIQQNNLSDASIISAGRDLSFVTSLTPDGNLDLSKSQYYKIEVAGPGDVLVKTGRNLDLGSSVGLSTVGNLYNSNLSSNGASMDVLVGLNGGTPDYTAFMDKYLPGKPYEEQFKQVKDLITQFMQERSGNVTLSESDALVAFRKLSEDEKLPIQPQLHAILTKVFFNELKIAGSASASDKKVGNQGGFDAIDTLFPKNEWKGDLSLFFSKLQTAAGGDINLMVPGGQVNAGLSVAPSGTGTKTADQLGIVVQGEGQINAFVKNDFIVNTSRVFTLGGGDVLIWSSEGNIDAGKGAKSALSVTIDPAYFDANDQLVIPAPRITNGSGIRTAASPGVTPGDVYLFAPKGIVNAGEAGIGGTNVTISATAVLGANNIQVGGVGTGVPVASTGSLAAGLTGTSNIGANASQVAQDSTGVAEKGQQSAANVALGVLTGEVLGFGECSTQQNDQSKCKGL